MDEDLDLLARLPAAIWDVPYAAARYPGSPAVADRPGIAAGANCQLFAYAVLGHFGRTVPPVRSSTLWTDAAVATRVHPARPLDLMLVNATDDAWGAHVGVCLGAGRVLHLCAEAGRPAVWTPGMFAARPRYRRVIGYVRVGGR